MEGTGGLTTMTKAETLSLPLLNTPKDTNPDIVSTTITGKFSSIAIIENIKISIAEFSHLNPDFDKSLSDIGSYELRLPADKMNLFQANKMQILEQSIRLMLSS